MKALSLLQKSKTVKERAEKYASRIAQSIKVDKIVPLEEEIEKIDDKIFDLQDFSLQTDLNKGLKRLTKEDCEERFAKIIDLQVEKTVLSLKLKATQDAYAELFTK
jgi:hypothetical protein